MKRKIYLTYLSNGYFCCYYGTCTGTVHSVGKSCLVTLCNSWMEFWAWLWFLNLRYRCWSCNKGNLCNHFHYYVFDKPVFWIRTHMFLGLPDPDPSIIKQKKVKKTLIPTVLWLFLDFLSLKNDVKVPSKSNKQKNFFISFFVGVFKVNNENSRIRIRIGSEQRHGSADPDPHQNVTDPEHWLKHSYP